MKFVENVPLAPYTTFKIGGPARFFCIVSNEDQLVEAITFAKKEKRRFLILGGGSNILISDVGFSGVVIKNEIMGVKITSEDSDTFRVQVGSGEVWDEFVDWSVQKGLYGLENLSAIPGSVGAAPVQNIGAYGAEISTSIEKVRVFDAQKMKFIDLSKKECDFQYRESIFKQEKNKYVITRVDFILPKKGKTNIEYKELKTYFSQPDKKAITNPTPAQVREAVIEIRWNKLPDWKLWGTAGSFFKNPVIAANRFERLKAKYPGIPGYKEPDGRYKVSAAWILDNVCKVKGSMDGRVGMYENQALVLVTKPGATASEVITFTKKLMEQIEHETTIKLEAEVEWVN